nr:immunoglobulin heavy chain junction region [Macaca mulatta]
CVRLGRGSYYYGLDSW